MPGSTHVPGVNHHVWKVLLESTVGRRFIPVDREDLAVDLCRLYRLQPTRGVHWMVVGACVVRPDGEVIERWGEIDPDGPARWSGFEAFDYEIRCSNGCRIPRGRLSTTIRARRLCLPCAYKADPRPHQIHQAAWLPPGAEPKNKKTAAAEGAVGQFRGGPRR